MKTIKESLFDSCSQHGIKLSAEGNRSFFCNAALSGHATFLRHITLDENHRYLQIKTFLPIKVPKNKRQKVAELIMRVNVNQLIGNFDWDMGTDEICYKTSTVVGRGSLHHDIVNHLFLSNWLAADKYLPAFFDVIFKNFAPTTALVIVDSSLVNGSNAIL